MSEPRYVTIRHTDHEVYAYQVVDRRTYERIGWGLREDHAEDLVIELEARAL